MVCPALNKSRQHLYSGSSLKNRFNKNLLEKGLELYSYVTLELIINNISIDVWFGQYL